MAADELDTRKKHRRSTDEGAEEGSKRRKHSHHHQSSSHHRRRHRHRSSKHGNDSKYEEDDTAPSFVPSSNSRPEDEKEEGEILEEEEEDRGAVHEEVIKKKMDSDVESGEIKPDEVVGRSDNRDRFLQGIRVERSSPGKSGEELEPNFNSLSGDSMDKKNAQSSKTLNVYQGDDALNVYQGDDVACDLAVNVRNKSNHHLTVHSDGEDEERSVEVPYLRESRTEHSQYRDKEYDVAEIDGLSAGSESIRSMEKKREMQSDIPPKDGGVSCANGDIGHKFHKEERRQHRVSGSPLKGTGKAKYDKESDENDSRRYARSRSPASREDVHPRGNRKTDDSGGAGVNNNRETELHNFMRYDSRLPSESIDAERNGSGDRNKSVSTESPRGKYKTLSYLPYHEKYFDKAHRNRSSSRDSMTDRRSRSQSVKSHKDGDERIEIFQSRESETINYDRERVRYSREDRHGSRDWVRDGERERNYSRYSDREARHGSRETWDRDRERVIGRESDKQRDSDKNRDRDRDWEKDRERERKREKDRDRDRNREREKDWDRERDRYRERERERDKDRGRETESDRVGRHHKYDDLVDVYGGLDRSKDSRRSKHDEWDYRGRKGKKDPVKVSSIMDDDLKRCEKKSQRDKEEEEFYEDRVSFQLAEQEEEDVDRIKEESRKRRQAILEKYKQQQHQSLQQAETLGQASNKEENDGSLNVDKAAEQLLPPKVVSSICDVPEDTNDSPDADFPEPTFSVWKSPPRNGTLVCGSTSGAGSLEDGTPKSERSADMFCDDIFGESPAGVRKMGKGDGLHIERSGLHDNWDDAEGYYSYRFGEILDGRYEVTAAHGKGVFSTVVRAKDLKAGKGDPGEVAIKIIRNNDTMYKAGLEELIILKKLAGADPENRRHCVRFISSFKYRNHLCLVFETLHMNLREVLKKFGRNIGLNLAAVREYAKQLFIALKHLRNCGVLHCDIKPDNMLVNEAKNVLKLCDFGNAMFAGKNEITPYLVSRFYRAPEIILGLPYDHPMDMWSVGCCLYELYSGKVLFPGPSNNDMLRLHMELKGHFPKKMLRKGAFINQHFDQDLSFHATEEDPVTKKTVKRLLLNFKRKEIGSLITCSPGEDPKMLANFKDLLEKIFVLDPEKRMTLSQALTHPFITGK
ncbi:hypothetical protein NE237_007661 [Protea cynaroides]|uniref:Serine/threonine-protein kinase PRP4 homolog n=1 Tax=Protea cynaroides TaxID=273540 RepID=A0A9Q0QWL4_9MAGN|nr:hypothetical protein NE237_007661 [Protea cynaroides]